MNEAEFLIVGAGGQLGTALQAQYPDARSADSTELDISDAEAVEAFDWNGIQIILNAAAYTNVDGAETTEGRVAAWRVNTDGVANLVAIAAQKDMTFVHISTDYVFDGKDDLYTETEIFSPISSYGASKAAGDLVVSILPKFYILRTSWVIGEGKNFVRTMLGLGKKEIDPTVVADQVGRLTFTSELVRAIDHLLKNNSPYGTYNVSNEGRSASWADITRKIFELADMPRTVTDTTTAEYYAGKENIAPRPLQSTLDLSRLQATGFTSTDWESELKNYIEKELAK